jgi:simple sugar transport system permease protein
MRTVGHDRGIATAAGINVDRTRIIAMIMSTLLAAYGQIISMQNFGVMQTYGAHSQVGVYAIAALLVGGATVTKASVRHALVGVLLFHSLFILAPIAGRELMGSALIGEYFRVFVANAVIAIALIMHAWKRVKSKKLAAL